MLSTVGSLLSASRESGQTVDRVVVINDFSASRGGATSVALTSADLLKRAGIPVTYVSGDSGANPDRRLNSVQLIAAGCQSIFEAPKLQASLAGLYNRRAETLLATWIAANDTSRTLYHLHGWSKILSPAVFRPLRSVAKRLLISAHDFFLVCPNGGYYDFEYRAGCDLRPMSAACLVRSCDRRSYGHKLWRLLRHTLRHEIFDISREGATIIAVHERMLPLLERGGLRRDQLTALRNPVTPWSTTRIRAELNKVFVFVGRVDADKGVDLFVAAARDAAVPVRIIGSGPLQEKVSKIYPEAEFIPWCQPQDIKNMVRDARAVVVPSRTRETFGLVAFEALTSGIPVLVSKLAMISDEITRIGAALACDPSDQSGFAKLLSRLASDDNLIESMSKAAHDNAQRLSLSPAEWTSRLLHIYGLLLRRSVTQSEKTRG